MSSDVPAEKAGGELPGTSSSGDVAGGVDAWSVALPDGVCLMASPELAWKPPAWLGSSLRRRMRLTVAAFAFAIVAVVVGAGFGLANALAPFTAGSVRTTGIVTDQQAYRSKGSDYCTLGIAYTLGGQQQYTKVGSGIACKASLQLGTRVQLALSPNNPSDVAVLGHGYPREDAWKGVAFVATFMVGFLGLFLLLWALSYRDAGRLFSQGRPWRGLTAVVRSRFRDRNGTTLFLEAPDTTGKGRIFTVAFYGSGPQSPKPKAGDTLSFALLADGVAHAAVSVQGEHKLHLVSLRVPNDFQLRALGL
jgi:hypothetical protein